MFLKIICLLLSCYLVLNKTLLNMFQIIMSWKQNYLKHKLFFTSSFYVGTNFVIHYLFLSIDLTSFSSAMIPLLAIQ